MPSSYHAGFTGFVQQSHLADIMTRIHDHKINRLNDLLAWNWVPLPTVLSEAA